MSSCARSLSFFLVLDPGPFRPLLLFLVFEDFLFLFSLPPPLLLVLFDDLLPFVVLLLPFFLLLLLLFPVLLFFFFCCMTRKWRGRTIN